MILSMVIVAFLGICTVQVASQSGGGGFGPSPDVLEYSEEVSETGESKVTLTFNSGAFFIGKDSNGYIMDLEFQNLDVSSVSLPSSGYWNEEEQKVLLADPSDSVDISFVVEGDVEKDTSISASVTDGNFTDTESFDVSLRKDLNSAVDENGNYKIDDSEILDAISYWASGEEYPDYGEEISDTQMMNLIDLWSNNTNFKEVSGA